MAGTKTMVEHRAFVVPIGFVLGLVIIYKCIVTYLQGRALEKFIILGFSTGICSIVSVITVCKHYVVHYSAAVSATIPAIVIILWQFVANTKNRKMNYRIKVAISIVILFAGIFSISDLIRSKIKNAHYRNQIIQHRIKLEELAVNINGKRLYTYHVPLSEFSIGMILYYSGIYELKERYIESNPSRISSLLAKSEQYSYVVIDKNYFPDLNSIYSAEVLDPLKSIDIRYQEGDEIIEFNRIFVVKKDG